MILLETPRHLLWRYRRPDEKIFLLEESRYQFYIRESNQLIRGRIGHGQERLFWELLASGSPSARIVCDEGKRRIHIRSESAQGTLDLDIQFGAAGLPLQVVQQDESGARAVYLFKNYRPKIRFKPGELALRVPPDAEIIEE